MSLPRLAIAFGLLIDYVEPAVGLDENINVVLASRILTKLEHGV